MTIFKPAFAVACLALFGCGGGNGDSSVTNGLPFADDTTRLSATPLQDGESVTAQMTGRDSFPAPAYLFTKPVTITRIDSDTVEMTVDGVTRTMDSDPLEADRYVDVLDSTVSVRLWLGTVSSSNAAIARYQNGDEFQTGAFVYGYLTDPDNIPSSGTPTFSGLADVDLLQTGDPITSDVWAISLDADFAAGTISGSIDADGDDIFITETAISGNAFSTGMTSPGVTLTNDVLSGAFYGETAGSVGGQFSTDYDTGSATGSIVGTFLAD